MVRPKSVRLSVAILVLCLLGAVGAIWILPQTSRIRYYEYRLVECDSNDLLPAIERMFDIVFPEHTSEMRAAKTIPIEGAVHFIVRFAADANSGGLFLDALQKEQRRPSVHLLNEGSEIDGRKAHYYPPPAWFTEVIEYGKVLGVTLDTRMMDVYVDMSTGEHVTLYIKGWFIEKYANKDEQ